MESGLGLSLFARRYSGNRNRFLFLKVLRCFSSLRSLYPAYVFSRKWSGITRIGLPHSEIPGSKVVCTYPRLIAAYHVLHRLLVPRHPPYALSNLTKHLRFTADGYWLLPRVALARYISCVTTLLLYSQIVKEHL